MKMNSYEVCVDEDLAKLFEAFCNSFAEKIELRFLDSDEV